MSDWDTTEFPSGENTREAHSAAGAETTSLCWKSLDAQQTKCVTSGRTDSLFAVTASNAHIPTIKPAASSHPYMQHIHINCERAHLHRVHIKMCRCALVRGDERSCPRLSGSFWCPPAAFSNLLNRLLLTLLLSPSDLIKARIQSSSSARLATIRLDFKKPRGPRCWDVQRGPGDSPLLFVRGQLG